MNFLNRFTLYAFGFLMGLIILVFIWKQKDAQFHYGPQARVKTSLLSKSLIEFQTKPNQMVSDSLIRRVINNGKVVFSKSITNRDSCNLYRIEYQEIQFLDIENCKHRIVIRKIEGF
ncbi:MAG: hypothetical protein OXC92_00460 [Flavobacteriaceae bacterium]|nr:hypothetical protein [Flavobacteriaceae bacterium]MCY4254028.1 hypothetical protein [Flavobacteriaceae bacterium]